MEHIYNDKKFGPPWFGFSDIYYDEILRAPQEGAHFIEVGSFMGKSASYMCVEIINSGKDITFGCIDTFEGSIEHQEMDVVKEKKLLDVFKENMSVFDDYPNFYFVQTTSLEAASQTEDKSLDFVFIDASHDYENVKADILAWIPKIKDGGTLAGDDWGFEGINQAVEEVFGHGGFTTRGRSWIAGEVMSVPTIPFGEDTIVKEVGFPDLQGLDHLYNFFKDQGLTSPNE